MKYYCPYCKTEMEPIYCECEFVAALHLVRKPDGRLYHERCGKPLSPKAQKSWERP